MAQTTSNRDRDGLCVGSSLEQIPPFQKFGEAILPRPSWTKATIAGVLAVILAFPLTWASGNSYEFVSVLMVIASVFWSLIAWLYWGTQGGRVAQMGTEDLGAIWNLGGNVTGSISSVVGNVQGTVEGGDEVRHVHAETWIGAPTYAQGREKPTADYYRDRGALVPFGRVQYRTAPGDDWPVRQASDALRLPVDTGSSWRAVVTAALWFGLGAVVGIGLFVMILASVASGTADPCQVTPCQAEQPE